MNLTEIESAVRQRKPNIKDNSVKAYALSLKAVVPEGATNFGFLQDPTAVMKSIEKYKENTRKNILNAVIVIGRGMEGVDLVPYEKQRDKYNEHYVDHMKARTKTASQEKNWVDWPDYVAMVEEMRLELVPLKSTSEGWTTPQKMAYQDYLVALLYQHYPLRNDFVATVVSKREFNKLTVADKRERNYLVRDGNGFFLALNEYKTSAKYGEKLITMEGPVLRALRKWLRHNDSGNLLITPRGEAMQPNGITKLLTRVGQERLGRSLGSSLLRHSYLSHKYADIAAEKQKDAALMMHSEAMQDGYIKD
eukprot:COSAG02_NODE_1464_length_12487_cov_122.573297_6_plen_307_part_00